MGLTDGIEDLRAREIWITFWICIILLIPFCIWILIKQGKIIW